MPYLKIDKGFVKWYKQNEDFTKYEINKIGDITTISTVTPNFIITRLHGYHLRIIKFEDEWFVIHPISVMDSPYYFKCDEFDGLIECIKKEF